MPWLLLGYLVCTSKYRKTRNVWKSEKGKRNKCAELVLMGIITKTLMWDFLLGWEKQYK